MKHPTDADLEESIRLVKLLVDALGDDNETRIAKAATATAMMIDGTRRPLGDWGVDDLADLHDEIARRGLT